MGKQKLNQKMAKWEDDQIRFILILSKLA